MDAHMVVHVRGVTWQFLDFTHRLPVTDNIASIMHLITTRHGGSITGLTLYKDEVHPRNLLSEPRGPKPYRTHPKIRKIARRRQKTKHKGLVLQDTTCSSLK